MRQHGARVLSERDLELLHFVAEQYLVTLSQLAYLAGRSERTARWLRTRWQRAGLIAAAKLLVDEPTVIWLTRPGLAALGLAWKTVRPSYETVARATLAVEVRLAAQERYPQAEWLSRRALANCPRARHPLPDGILSRGQGTVAIVAAVTELDQRQRKHLLDSLIWEHDHTLLVMATVSERTREWIDRQAGRVSAISFQRDPQRVAFPRLPALAALEPRAASEEGWPMPSRVDRYRDLATQPHTDPV